MRVIRLSATVECPHPLLLTGTQDWYRFAETSPEPKQQIAYIKKHLRPRHIKHGYIHKILQERRRKLFDDVCRTLLADQIVTPVHTASLRQRFMEQADKWDRETAHMSSPLQRMTHPSYQAILGMSAESRESKRDIVAYMLRDLKSTRREWSLALSYLTQQNPINPKDYGRTDKVNAAWIKWGENEGLL